VGVTLGIFGGTFDPPHLGHLAAAQEALDRCGLARVVFAPTERNPLKLDEPISETRHRLAMTKLAIADDERFALSTADLGHGGPAYTVDLLVRLRAQLGAGERLAFIAGLDVLHELPRWREPLRVLELARLIVISRPGQPAASLDDLEARLPGASAGVTIVETPGVAISSTEIRERVAAGRPIRYLVPDAVAAYIARHGLYAAR
jgi:nicotinate-nucleotide adenylyltransferase